MRRVYKTEDGRVITSLDELGEKDTVRVFTYHDETDLAREADLTIKHFSKRVFLYTIRALMNENEKIQAIRLVRAYTGWELADSKQFVEGMGKPKYYECEVCDDGSRIWKLVGKKTVDQVLSVINHHHAIDLNGIVIWKTGYGCFTVTNVKEYDAVLADDVSKEDAIQVFREQFNT